MNTESWFCDLCGRRFSRQHLVKKHTRACRVDAFLSIHADETLNGKLRQFHDDKANLSVGTRRKSKGLVQATLDDILSNGSNRGRYETEADLEGSYKTGLKIGKPDEFDFSVGLKLPPSRHVTGEDAVGFQYMDDDIDHRTSSDKRRLNEDRHFENTDDNFPPVGYKVVKLRKCKSKRFSEAVINGILVPYEVLVKFHQFVTDAVDDLDGNNIRVGKCARGPAISLNITDGSFVHKISVDLTPVVYIGEAEPILRDHGWPRSKTLVWLPQDKINRVQAREIYLVPKGDKFWKVSFARCENEILKDIDGQYVDGQYVDGTRKTCLRICKMKLKQWKSKSQDGMKAISSYMLKMVILWLCEFLPNDEDWYDDQLSARYYNFMSELQYRLSKRYLGEYFIPSINLLEDKDENDIEEMLDFIGDELQTMASMVDNTYPSHWLTSMHGSREQ